MKNKLLHIFVCIMLVLSILTSFAVSPVQAAIKYKYKCNKCSAKFKTLFMAKQHYFWKVPTKFEIHTFSTI